MPFFPIAESSDDRSARGAVPLVLRNCTLEPIATGAQKKTSYIIVPAPGLLSKVTPSAGKNLRGLFNRAGVVDGVLFAVMGDTLYSVSDVFTATSIGTIGGTGHVQMDSIGADLVILASGMLYVYDGATLTQVTDINFPSNAVNLVCLADRVLVNEEGSDTFDWSAAGDPFTWPATGFASSARLPDPITASIEISGYKWDFGAVSTQVWAPQGGLDSEAFDLLSSIIINRGIIGHEAIARIDNSAMWVGEDRVVYQLDGFAPTRVPNRDLEIAMAALSEAEANAVRCFSFANGSHLTWVVRLPSGRAWQFDTMMRQWSELTTFASSAFRIAHYARFQGHHIVGSDTSDKIYEWNYETYSDDGEEIERVAMVHVPVQGRAPIANVTLDIKAYDQPLSGQGSAPQAMLTFFRDGGSLDVGIERIVSLGAAGHYDVRPTCWRLGLSRTIDGFLLKIRITDPIGFALHGIYVNELPK